MNNYLQISPELMEHAEITTLRALDKHRERIDALGRLAALKGRYVTKRLEPEIKALFPGYAVVYIDSSARYCHRLAAHIRRTPYGYQDTMDLDIALDTDRRVSLDMINAQIDAAKKELAADTAALDAFRDAAAQWNNLIAYAAAIHGTLRRCLTHCDGYPAETIRRMFL